MSKTKFILLSLVAIVGIAVVAIWLFNVSNGSIPYSGPWEPKRHPVEVRVACEQHVREADMKAMEAISKRASEFSSFIQDRKAGAKPFSKDVVSLYGKWRAMKPGVERVRSYYDAYNELTNPTAVIWKKLWGEKTNVEKFVKGEEIFDKDSHKIFVSQKFDAHIFSSDELAAAMRRSIEGAVRDLEGIENELAVALRQEILGRSLAPNEIPIASDEFKTAITRMVVASQRDAAKTAGNLVVSEIASQVGSQVFVRLGVSSGILTAGAANSWWSFGAALVIGVAVDMIWEWVDDPAGDIEREMIVALDNLSTQGSTAIREEMAKTISARSKLWKEVIKNITP